MHRNIHNGTTNGYFDFFYLIEMKHVEVLRAYLHNYRLARLSLQSGGCFHQIMLKIDAFLKLIMSNKEVS